MDKDEIQIKNAVLKQFKNKKVYTRKQLETAVIFAILESERKTWNKASIILLKSRYPTIKDGKSKETMKDLVRWLENAN